MEAACQSEDSDSDSQRPPPTENYQDYPMSDLNDVDIEFDAPATDFRPSTTLPTTPEATAQATPMEHPTQNEEERFVQDFTPAAGVIKGEADTQFEALREDQNRSDDPPWAPFETKKEWELARWLMICGISQSKINDFLKMEIVSRLIF